MQNLDLLQASEELYAVKELILRIDHRLIYRAGVSYEEIGRVYSHRQALDQCSVFLAQKMPFASLKETESTAFGISRAAEDFSGKSAAIAGAHTSPLPEGFEMSEKCISDEQNNFTQFLLVKKGRESLPLNSDKLFFPPFARIAGSLLALLQIIAEYGINMTKIESRPVKNRPGDYRFFVEAEGDVGGELVRKALAEIAADTLECKLIGAYKRA